MKNHLIIYRKQKKNRVTNLQETKIVKIIVNMEWGGCDSGVCYLQILTQLWNTSFFSEDELNHTLKKPPT
jgi:hypothetical protein